MVIKKLIIKDIPAILWGKCSNKLFLAIHGRMSHKEDEVIAVFAEEAVKNGYQVLSFDLPEHGDRQDKGCDCSVQNCIADLNVIMNFATSISNNIRVFACSMGAYFTFVAYKEQPLKQCIFLSPVVDMEMIINKMMISFNVSEYRLKIEKEVTTPVGILNWDYYSYVKSNPIMAWNKPTLIICGFNDDVCGLDVITKFANEFSCDLMIMKNGGHYFHKPEELQFFRSQLETRLIE